MQTSSLKCLGRSSTEWVPRLYTKMFDEPARTRAVRR